MSLRKAHLILYVADQAKSTAFYSRTLGLDPALDVPGMTEFRLLDGCVLGLMPIDAIKRLLGPRLPDPVRDGAGSSCELYLYVSRPDEYHRRALEAGAVELSPLGDRSWGDRAAYSLDPDGHVIAFAEPAR